MEKEAHNALLLFFWLILEKWKQFCKILLGELCLKGRIVLWR